MLKFRFSSASEDIFQRVLLSNCFPLALIWSLAALTILTGIIYNMAILLLHLQFKVILIGTFTKAFSNVNNVRTNFHLNLEWLNGLRSEENICC